MGMMRWSKVSGIFSITIILLFALIAISYVPLSEAKLSVKVESSEDLKKIKDPEKLKEQMKKEYPEKLKELKKIKDPKDIKNLKEFRVFEGKNFEGKNFIAYATTLYTTKDDPSNHLTPNGGIYDGVVELTFTTAVATVWCSAALLPTGQHLLTAAHCLTDGSGNFDVLTGFATFEGDAGTISINLDLVNSFTHPNWDGNFIKGNDIAVVPLASPAPAEITRYNIASSGSAVNQNVEKIGYGISGFLASGIDPINYPFGEKRNGLNKYDAIADSG